MPSILPLAFEFTSPSDHLQIGPISIRWYGLLIATAVIIGTVLAAKLAPKRGVKSEFMEDLVIWLAIGAIPGARAYYVAFAWHDKFQNQPWYKVFAIWEGGIAIHGAIIGGAIAAILFARRNSLSFWKIADLVMPSLILGQAIGRWGNFFNSEAFGTPTDLPWKLYIPPCRIEDNIQRCFRPAGLENVDYYHPTFLYESFWNLMVFGILMSIFNRFPKAKPGTLVTIYAIAYSSGRLWIEALRTDSLMLGPLRIAQVISLSSIALGVFGLWWLYGRRGRFWDTVAANGSE
jgi:phosphatidylglycerol---prolipoprotein diacylglyceryl transferase